MITYRLIARFLLALMSALALFVAVIAPISKAQDSPFTPAVWYIGISPKLPPGNSLNFRLAVAHGIDRVAVARAANPYAWLPGSTQPAGSIQFPSLSGYNPSVRAQTYDPAKADDFWTRSGWTSTITIATSNDRSSWTLAIEAAIQLSLARSLGAGVSFDKAPNFAALVSSARSGAVPIWLYGWRADPQDFGYPSKPLALANAYSRDDPEIQALVEKGAGQEVEQLLLDKALIIPVVFYLSRPP